jgi:hypothetical protein
MEEGAMLNIMNNRQMVNETEIPSAATSSG